MDVARKIRFLQRDGGGAGGRASRPQRSRGWDSGTRSHAHGRASCQIGNLDIVNSVSPVGDVDQTEQGGIAGEGKRVPVGKITSRYERVAGRGSDHPEGIRTIEALAWIKAILLEVVIQRERILQIA